MSTTAPVAAIDRDIAATWAELQAARARHTHSPNADTAAAADETETRFNGLLELRHQITHVGV